MDIIKMNQQKGFTLVELMTVIAIIGILAAIVYPSYQESVRKSRRADAKGALTSFSNAMERRFTEAGNYCDVADATSGSVVAGCGDAALKDKGSPANFSKTSPVGGPEIYYNLTINAVTATSYTLWATPTGAQAKDKCGTLTLTNIGDRNFITTTSGVTLDQCW